MKTYAKLSAKYWLYNQLFFITAVIMAAVTAAAVFLPLAPFYNFLSRHLFNGAGFYLSVILFYALLAAGLVPLYKLSIRFWHSTLAGFGGKPESLVYISLLPLTCGAALFSLLFYLADGSVMGLISAPSFYLLGFIHGSFFILTATLSTYAPIALALILLTNLIPLAFFIHYIRIMRGVKPMLAKPLAYAGLVLALCALSINYSFENGNTVRTHRFDYENGLSSVDLMQYKITNPNNILPQLDGPCSLQLKQEDWLVLDGAEAAYPVYSAFANACYNGITKYQYDDSLPTETQSKLHNEFNKYIAFNNTVYAFNDLINKRCDIFFGAMPSQKQRQAAAELGEELVLTPIAQEAFVFFVNSTNPVNSLTTQQIKDIYSGKIKNWQQLNGTSQRILAFQRPEGSGSQTLLQHIMDGTPLMQPLKTEYIRSMGGIGESVAAYNGDAGALGFSFKFFLTGMLGRKDAPVKILAINGIAPDNENIRSGKYPFTTKLYAITLKSNTKPQLKTFLDWMQSPQGQELAGKVGYVRLK